MDELVSAFREMNAEAGIEMTMAEAKTNYAACMTALVAVTDEENPLSVEDAIEMIQKFADASFHPGVCKKFLTEALEIIEKDKL